MSQNLIKRVLIVGLGSIGKRHLRLARQFLPHAEIAVLRHKVDLVIPEIPSIACKRNSFGREIIERIQLSAGHGQFLHYHPSKDESIIQNYFNPRKLHRLTIQLYAPNNELYDTRNSDNSFEFEITMVSDKKLLH